MPGCADGMTVRGNISNRILVASSCLLDFLIETPENQTTLATVVIQTPGLVRGYTGKLKALFPGIKKEQYYHGLCFVHWCPGRFTWLDPRSVLVAPSSFHNLVLRYLTSGECRLGLQFHESAAQLCWDHRAGS